MVRQEKPMVGRWRDNNGERPCRHSAIEIEYNDGTSEVTYANKVDWSLDITLEKVESDSKLIRRWRPFYAWGSTDSGTGINNSIYGVVRYET